MLNDYFEIIVVILWAGPEYIIIFSLLIMVIYGLKRWVYKILCVIFIFCLYTGFRVPVLPSMISPVGANGFILDTCWGGISRGMLIIVCLCLLLMYSQKTPEGDS